MGSLQATTVLVNKLLILHHGDTLMLPLILKVLLYEHNMLFSTPF